MKISVILCTYNRCKFLPTALESVAKSQLPEAVDWEVLIVDNNSKDQTRQVSEEFVRRYPGRFRYIFEAKQGKSHALNTGIRESQGDVLAFMDDDVTVEGSWLANLTNALADGAWAGSGGLIRPPLDFVPPKWMSLKEPYDLGGALCACFDRGETPGLLDRAPYGTNMAFRREVFEKYGVFRTDLGPCPGSELRGEDTEFCVRVMDGGERLRWEPAAVVYHSIPPNRLEKKFYLRWWYDFGRGFIRRRASVRPDVWFIPRPVIGLTHRALVMIPRSALKWLLSLDPQRRFFLKCHTWMIAGETAEMYRQFFHSEPVGKAVAAQAVK